MTALDTPTASARLARLDGQVRVAFRLTRGAQRREHLLLAASAAAATAAAWPFPGALHALVAIPGVLLLITLIRLHGDSLGERRSALMSAGADRADAAVITAFGPIAAAVAGAFVGAVASVVDGHPQAVATHALVPLLAAVIATVALRPRWVDASAPAAGTAGAAVAAIAVVVSSNPSAMSAMSATSAGSASATALVAAQVAGRKRNGRTRG